MRHVVLVYAKLTDSVSFVVRHFDVLHKLFIQLKCMLQLILFCVVNVWSCCSSFVEDKQHANYFEDRLRSFTLNFALSAKMASVESCDMIFSRSIR